MDPSPPIDLELLHPILDFWDRRRVPTAATAPARRGTPARRRRTTRHDRTPSRRAVAVDDPGAASRIKRFSATHVNFLFLLYFDTRAGYQRHRPVRRARPSPTGRCSSATSTGSAPPLSRGATCAPASRTRTSRVARARGRHVHDHRLRDVEPRPGGLPRPRRRARPCTPPTVDAHRESAPSRSTSSTTSSPRCGRRSRRTTGSSSAWTAWRRSAAVRTSTSRSCGPFAALAGVEDAVDWTVPAGPARRSRRADRRDDRRQRRPPPTTDDGGYYPEYAS